MFYLVKTPWILKKLYAQCTWEVKTSQKDIYITFDDGPHPAVTPFVLEQLEKYQAKATFFCLGKNVEQYFDIYKQVIEGGHKPGNHTFNHLNGWKTDDKKYLQDIAHAAEIIDTDLFRPPYGKITHFQLKALKGTGYGLQTVMWNVLSGDFDESISGEDCYLNVTNNAQPGSIIVFHDSLKALPRLQFALPRVLEYFASQGFQCKAISSRQL
jgi:peptidoglycan-N-acetylglucosamine deacetylase